MNHLSFSFFLLGILFSFKLHLILFQATSLSSSFFTETHKNVLYFFDIKESCFLLFVLSFCTPRAENIYQIQSCHLISLLWMLRVSRPRGCVQGLTFTHPFRYSVTLLAFIKTYKRGDVASMQHTWKRGGGNIRPLCFFFFCFLQNG